MEGRATGPGGDHTAPGGDRTAPGGDRTARPVETAPGAAKIAPDGAEAHSIGCRGRTDNAGKGETRPMSVTSRASGAGS